MTVDVRQVLPKDAIPSVDDPEFEADYPGDPTDRVFAVEIDGDARAYPIRYLNYHEIVNDEVGGTPVAVTWCPLCGSGIAYDRRVVIDSAERVLEFGVSGKLADDDLVMYDRETGSEWKQSAGECIADDPDGTNLDGTTLLEGTTLDVLPAAMTPYRSFRTTHPDGCVLARPGGESEAAGAGDEPEPVDYDEEPYREYVTSDGFGLGAHRGGSGRDWERDDIDPKTVVLGVEFDDDALGFPLPIVEAAGGVVTATVGETRVVVFATHDGIHAFENPGYEWASRPGGFRGEGESGGALYDGATGEPVDAPAAHTGESGGVAADPLERVPARRLFAFAWQDDHGPDAFYGL